MVPTIEQSKSVERKPVARHERKYTGEVVYIYAFDVAYEMVRKPVRELLGQPVAQFVVDATKRTPRQLFFYRPQMIRLPPLERLTSRGPVRLERTVKLLPVGAISITVRVQFSVGSLGELVDYHDLRFSDEPKSFDEVLYIMELANLQLAELEAYDRILDTAVDRSYRDLSSTSRLRGRSTTKVQRELREIRVDLARLSDELSNITKFFG